MVRNIIRMGMDKQTNSENSFLVVLYGTLEYDGRAQRMTKILCSLGNVTVVDLKVQGPVENDAMLNIHRISINLPKRFGKLVEHLYFWKFVLQVALRVKPSVVVAEDYFTLFPGWLSAKLCKSKLIYDAHELIIPTPGLAMSKRDLFWYWLERFTIYRAHLVIAANKERAGLMAKHYKLKQIPTTMRNIPSCHDLQLDIGEILKQFPKLAIRKPGLVFVLYQGNIERSRGIDRFVEAMKYLPSHFLLLVVGSGPDFDWLKDYAKALEQEGRFIALGRVPNYLLPYVTRQADVGIVTYPFEGLNYVYCSPNKIYEYAQAGLPVVATDQPPLRELVSKYGIGGLISKFDSPQEIAEIIWRVALRGKEGYNNAIKKFIEENRSEDEAERVREVIKDILNKGASI